LNETELDAATSASAPIKSLQGILESMGKLSFKVVEVKTK